MPSAGLISAQCLYLMGSSISDISHVNASLFIGGSCMADFGRWCRFWTHGAGTVPNVRSRRLYVWCVRFGDDVCQAHVERSTNISFDNIYYHDGINASGPSFQAWNSFVNMHRYKFKRKVDRHVTLQMQKIKGRPARHRTKSRGRCIEPDLNFFSTTRARQPCLLMLSPTLLLLWSPAWTRKPQLEPKKKPAQFEFLNHAELLGKGFPCLADTLSSSSINAFKNSFWRADSTTPRAI